MRKETFYVLTLALNLIIAILIVVLLISLFRYEYIPENNSFFDRLTRTLHSAIPD
ncbi:hypothetical protein [Scatolibacter rhodanostii]|uniref:hypothetical protein n=1 Tax=Scatolibacter rhodanostii TaxID=2014781 RepID=UPI0013565E6C|nr:hypothetical protein [Scatolibacter rhodanostii]